MGDRCHSTGYGGPAGAGDDGDVVRVLEWEEGLPSGGDLAPLSQPLITRMLASAFGIAPEPSRTILDVFHASEKTIASLCGQVPSSSSSSDLASPKAFPSFAAADLEDPVVIEGDGSPGEDDSGCYTSKRIPLDAIEEADSPLGLENASADGAARTQKRPRLVWTGQLHKRFVEVVDHLGSKNAVPKTIMHMMNVEGLTRENVASHLQKYRLYLKRNEGPSSEGPPSSDHVVASSPVLQGLDGMRASMPMPFAAPPALAPMPVLAMAQNGPGAHVAGMPVNCQHCAVAYHGFGACHPYTAFEERQRDRAGGSKFFPMAPYPRASPNGR